MYWAKRSGRDQSRRYDRRLAGELSGDGQRAEVEALLANEGSIVPVFQPVLELATGRVAGYEALARMPDGPFRPPDQWFAQAHRAGLGAALEAAALRAALRAGGRPERTFLALNVSPGALLSPEVRDALPDDLSGIVIELTEHELFSADASLDREIGRLRARGARIALDDAGNGYAGLQQIIRIAPDVLKLDRSLVDGIHDDPHRFALLEALISFASTTRAAICAEGVEALEDLAVLAGLDVTYAQGWALARPDAPWAVLSPGAAAAGSADLRLGLRVARETSEERAPTLGDVIALLAGVSCVDDIRAVAEMIPAVLGARRRGGLARRARRGLRRGHQPPRLVAAGPALRARATTPSTAYVLRTRTAGQVVAGDPASDPAEVAAARARRLPGRCCWSRSCSAAATSGCSSSTAATRCPGARARSSAPSCWPTSSPPCSTCSRAQRAA